MLVVLFVAFWLSAAGFFNFIFLIFYVSCYMFYCCVQWIPVLPSVHLVVKAEAVCFVFLRHVADVRLVMVCLLFLLLSLVGYDL